MNLTDSQKEKLRNLDIVQTTHQAREDAYRLMNDQGFTVFAILISNIIAEMAEHPEKLIKEFGT